MGVTIMVAVTFELVALTAVKDAILPVPDAGSPMEGRLFVQLYTVPTTGEPSNIIAVVGVNPLQTV